MATKEQFYYQLNEQYPDSEVTLLINSDPNCGFYEVCRSYLDIALNALKVRIPDKKLGGVFQYADINVAKEMTISFIQKNHIKDVEVFFSIIESLYSKSDDPNDQRQKAGIIKEDDTRAPVGYYGTYFCFTKISDNIYHQIVDEIKRKL